MERGNKTIYYYSPQTAELSPITGGKNISALNQMNLLFPILRQEFSENSISTSSQRISALCELLHHLYKCIK